MKSGAWIELRGVAVHNLQHIDLDIPRERLVVVCGVSGSGKTSLAMDTLFAEGQRRFVECFSAYSRQFLARLPRPQAQRIAGIPPAVAMTQNRALAASRGTLGSLSEISDYLRVLFAKAARPHCPQCREPIRPVTAEQAAHACAELPAGTNYIVAHEIEVASDDDCNRVLDSSRHSGVVRWIIGEKTVRVDEVSENDRAAAVAAGGVHLVRDRLTAGVQPPPRVREAFEIAFRESGGNLALWVKIDPTNLPLRMSRGEPRSLDGSPWQLIRLDSRLRCPACDVTLPSPEPRLFHVGNPLGICDRCKGIGRIRTFDPARAIPDPNKSLSEGAVAPWNLPAYAHHQAKLLEVAASAGYSIHKPFRDLPDVARQLVFSGASELGFTGLDAFLHHVDLGDGEKVQDKYWDQWRRDVTCPDCGGSRLGAAARAFTIDGHSIDQLEQRPVTELRTILEGATSSSVVEQRVLETLISHIRSRLEYLEFVGLGYLSIGRALHELSSGELQRVALTKALGSSLVNMLYVLDEPSAGLHAVDVERVIGAIQLLRDRGNSVIVVEHEEAIVRAADRVIEIGPAAGEAGGRVTFEGTPAQLCRTKGVLTGDYLSGRRGRGMPEQRRSTSRGWIRILDAHGKNLRHLDVQFPLGVLAAVCGVSGSGKSALVEETLYTALCERKRKKTNAPLPFREVTGDGAIDDVILVDQSPIGRTPRSNPVTFIKAFDEIRKVFAETLDARVRNLQPGHFSFNVDGGGRCPTCEGDGSLSVDMQFLADVRMDCPDCLGRRYRRDILEIRYRGQSIADVLDMTASQAYTFFRGQTRVQGKLQRLMEVGLDYVRLGQPASTLSAGEAQRLKLATHLGASQKSRILFLLDEPTRGLHFSDVVQLLDCFDALLSVGHSLIVVEHNLQLLRSADYVLELGPGPGPQGGELICQGTPEQLAASDTPTGRALLASDKT